MYCFISCWRAFFCRACSQCLHPVRQTIEGDIVGAERVKSEAEKVRDAYEKVLAATRVRSQVLLHEAEASVAARNNAENNVTNAGKEAGRNRLGHRGCKK